MIRAVIFDIGGVLEHTPDLGITAQWEQIFHLRPGELDRKLGHLWEAGGLGLLNEEQISQEIGKVLGISPTQVETFMADIWRQYLGTLNTELTEYFQALRPRYQTAIISNSFVGARQREQASYHFDEMCECILYSHEEGIAKPDPQLFARACQRLGVQPEETIFVDDNEDNVLAARAFGMHAVQFRTTQQAIKAIEGYLHAEL